MYLDHRTHPHPGVHRVQDCLVAHPEKKPALAQLAPVAASSARHLTRVFRSATGITPKQFAAKVKVQVARDLLADPQRTVEAIAESCGFEDARQRFVESDRIIFTAGGLSSGIDLALHVVELYFGRDVETAKYIEYEGKGWLRDAG